MNEVKRTCEKAVGVAFSTKLTLSYTEFERFLFEAAVLSFGETIPIETKIRMMVLQAKPYIETEYGVVVNPDKSVKRSRDAAKHLSLQQFKGRPSGMQIDLNISAALLALKSPLKPDSSFTSQSPTRNRTPDRTLDPSSSMVYKGKARLSETDRGTSPSRFVRTASRNLSTTSIGDFMVTSRDRSSFGRVSSEIIGETKVKVRLKKPSIAGQKASSPGQKSRKESDIQRHRRFIVRSRALSFTSVSVI